MLYIENNYISRKYKLELNFVLQIVDKDYSQVAYHLIVVKTSIVLFGILYPKGFYDRLDVKIFKHIM